MTVWRLHIRPKGGKADPKLSFGYCIKNDVVGMGWSVPESAISKTTRDKEKYLNACERTHKKDSGWKSSVQRFIDEVNPGDLIWTLSPAAEYYLARIPESDGHWEYRPTPEAFDADVVNVRRVQFYKVGLADAVPGKVINAFNGPGQTFRQLPDHSAEIFARTWLEKHHAVPFDIGSAGNESIDVFRYFSPEDLENLVFVWLQTQGWMVLPGSRRPQQLAYEFVLVRRETGERAIIQVKSGDIWLPAHGYAGSTKTFLFAMSGNYGNTDTHPLPENVSIIPRSTLETFMEENPRILPDAVKTWIDVANKINDRKISARHK